MVVTLSELDRGGAARLEIADAAQPQELFLEGDVRLFPVFMLVFPARLSRTAAGSLCAVIRTMASRNSGRHSRCGAPYRPEQTRS
jgi:hypothetical protein